MSSNALVFLSHDEAKRVQLIRILGSMGVRLPPSTKLPASALRRRIAKGLDLSESLHRGMSHCTRDDIEKWSDYIGSFDVVRSMIAHIAKTFESGDDVHFSLAESEGDSLVVLKVRKSVRIFT